jgi:hypothetical protein
MGRTSSAAIFMISAALDDFKRSKKRQRKEAFDKGDRSRGRVPGKPQGAKCGKEEEERATESKTSREESGLIRGRQFSGEKS